MTAVHPALGPEAQLLLLSAALRPDGDRIRRILEQPLDWNGLLQLAVHQKAVSGLWRALEATVPDRVPTTTRSAAVGLRMVADFRMAVLRQRLEEAVGTLAAAGVRPMILKGAGLGLTVYPSFGERPMGDVDLLVPEAAAAQAQSALRAVGWRSDVEGVHEAFYAEHHHLPPLTDPHGSGIVLEIHTGLFAPGHPFRLPAEALWATAREVGVGHHSAWVADPHDAMVHLCIHFLWSHGASSGAWRTFRDVDALAGSGLLDWSELHAKAVSSRSTSCVYWTVRLARALAGVNVPSEVVERFRPRGSEFLLRRVEHHLATTLLPSTRACPSRTLARWMWEAAVQPRASGHGEARPWAHDELAREAFLRTQPPTPWKRVVIQLQAMRGWARYLAAILLRPPASRPTH